MNIFQSLTQKVKMAALSFLVMVFVVLYALRVDTKTQNMDDAVEAVYKDRLQPALIIVYLSENLHAKRRLLENHLGDHSGLTTAEVRRKLSEYDARNNRLIADFERTVLTTNEAAVLLEFKNDAASNARLEGEVMQQLAEKDSIAASVRYTREGTRGFKQSIQNLHMLAQIQAETGQEIVHGSHRDAAGLSIITTLMIATAVIIGILILSLLQKTPVPNHRL